MLAEAILHQGNLIRRAGVSLVKAACSGRMGGPSQQVTSALAPSTPLPWQQQQQQCLHVCSAFLHQRQQNPWQGQQQRPHAWWQAGCIQQQQQQVAHMATLAPYAAAPQPLPRFHKPDRGGRMQRMVIRVPPEVQVTLQDQHLLLSGKAGTVRLDVTHLDPTGLLGWQVHFLKPSNSPTSSSSGGAGADSIQSSSSSSSGSSSSGEGALVLCVSPSKRYFRGIQTHINNAVTGVTQGYLVGVAVKGVGYRMEPVEEAVVAAALSSKAGPGAVRRMYWEQEAEKNNPPYPYPNPVKAVRLKVGYTRAAIFPLPEGVLAFFVRPTLMYLYGVDKHLVTNTAAAIRAVRKPNPYTGNGIQLADEEVKIKQRAGSK